MLVGTSQSIVEKKKTITTSKKIRREKNHDGKYFGIILQLNSLENC